MTIQKETVENTIIVKPEGRLDTLSSRDFERVVLESCDQAQKIILDLSGVSYISSAGLRTIIQAYKRMKDKEGILVTNACDQVKQIFELTGYDHVVKIV